MAMGSNQDPTTDYGRYDDAEIVGTLWAFNARFRDITQDSKTEYEWNQSILAFMDACWQAGFDQCLRET